jgi:xanthine dehydrogenase YagS FAD-binding subunit
MKAFEYAGPSTVEEALALLGGKANSSVLSGGTDLLCRMKDYVSTPERLVYVNKIGELAGVKAVDGGSHVIGAATKLAALVADEAVARHYPALRQAALEVGTPQIRNMATVGGNLLQRPRCWYFRNGFGLLGGKQEGQSLVSQLEGEYAPIPVNDGFKGHIVREGDNRYGAIFMTDGDALYVNPSSLAVPLVALGATARIKGPKGERSVPVAELYRVPKTDGESELSLAADELLIDVTIPPPKGRNASYEVRQKQSHDWPLVICSVCCEMEGATVKSARIALGAVAPLPLLCEPAAAAITGKTITPETAEAAGKAAVASAKPLSMNAYKVKLTEVAVKRALLAAAGNRYWEA